MKISFITASYNYEDYIKETIESVLNQTYTDFEMVIVDDGSKDNSVEVIKYYQQKDDRIKLYQHENNKNKGLIETLKLGIEKAQGEWIVFLESDDTIIPEYLEKKLEIIKKYPDIKFIYNDVKMFGDEITKKNREKYFEKLYKILEKIKFPAKVLKYFKNQNIVPTFSVVMLKKELLKNIEWNCELQKCIDWYIWIQVSKKCEFYYIPEKLTNWRMHKDSYINKCDNQFKEKHFLFVFIPNAIKYNKYKFFNYLNYLMACLKIIRKNMFYIHAREKEICIFGKKIKYQRKKRK